MMKQEYLKELFSLQLGHKHLTDITTGYFQTEPTDECRKTLSSYGLYFKPQTRGFVVVAPYIQHTDTGLLELANQFADMEKLSFVIFTTDKTFFDHADLPYDTPGDFVYYFNNLNENARRTRLLLDNCGVKENERVKLHPKLFSGTIAKTAGDNVVQPKVFDCRNIPVTSTRFDFTADEYKNSYHLDLTRLGDGLYTIEYNGETTTCYCADASFIRRIPLAILEVFVGPDVPVKYQVIQRANGVQYLDYKQFCLYFGMHLCYWQYKIIPIKTPAYTYIKILTDQDNYTFTPSKSEVNSYWDPVLFTSEQLIDAPNDELTFNLYRLNWDGQCRLTSSSKYKYCNQEYGIELNSDFWCRQLVNGTYPYKCPARSTDVLIGALPKAGEVTTKYYTQEGKDYAQMTLYLVYQNGQYVIKETYEPDDYRYKVIEENCDLTIQFISKIDMTYVDLYYYVVDKISQKSMRMNKIGNIYSMEKIVTRFCYPHLEEGDRVVFWFVYQTVAGQKTYTSDTWSHIYGSV